MNVGDEPELETVELFGVDDDGRSRSRALSEFVLFLALPGAVPAA